MHVSRTRVLMLKDGISLICGVNPEFKILIILFYQSSLQKKIVCKNVQKAILYFQRKGIFTSTVRCWCMMSRRLLYQEKSQHTKINRHFCQRRESRSLIIVITYYEVQISSNKCSVLGIEQLSTTTTYSCILPFNLICHVLLVERKSFKFCRNEKFLILPNDDFFYLTIYRKVVPNDVHFL